MTATRSERPAGAGQRTDLDVAVIVPCYNEEAAIGRVVTDLRAALPEATVYVYDNSSTDRTALLAAEAGAVVRREGRKGKGNVVRRAFSDIDADVYVMIDGDDTYDAAAAGRLVDTLLSGPYDQVVGVRRQVAEAAYRPGHAWGNRALTGVVATLFGREVTDMLSGYRAFSRRFVKSFPALSPEFEIETELTVHALTLRLPQTEVEVDFRDRPAGGESKLRTYRDGWRIVRWITKVIRFERPLLFHSVLAAVVALASVVLGLPVVVEYLHTGLVPRFPTAFLASSLMVIAALLVTVGFILDAIRRGREEAARLTYLRYPAPATR